MNEIIPYLKMSKKQKKEQDMKKRRSWGAVSPVTRCPPVPGAYNRAKEKAKIKNTLR